MSYPKTPKTLTCGPFWIECSCSGASNDDLAKQEAPWCTSMVACIHFSFSKLLSCSDSLLSCNTLITWTSNNSLFNYNKQNDLVKQYFVEFTIAIDFHEDCWADKLCAA